VPPPVTPTDTDAGTGTESTDQDTVPRIPTIGEPVEGCQVVGERGHHHPAASLCYRLGPARDRRARPARGRDATGGLTGLGRCHGLERSRTSAIASRRGTRSEAAMTSTHVV